MIIILPCKYGSMSVLVFSGPIIDAIRPIVPIASVRITISAWDDSCRKKSKGDKSKYSNIYRETKK